jgi:zinc-binding alcohol dehydrogenase/oxidoreductase
MGTMKAVVFKSKDQGPIIKETPTPEPAKGQVLVKLSYAALNHLDLWVWKEQTLGKEVISGSDGVGVIYAAGEDVDVSLIGKEVIINPSLHWGDNEAFQSDEFEILGEPTNGTFAEFIVIAKEYVYTKPIHLNSQHAAALPLAALTAYRALFTKAKLTSQDKVLITGIGGGVALFLLQMATAISADVYVTSSLNEKLQRAISLGAKGGFNYKNLAWQDKVTEEVKGFDVIIDGAGGEGFAVLLEMASPGARIVTFGRTAGNIKELKPSLLYNKQLQILGTLMGTPTEFALMIKFFEQHQLVPIIDKEFGLDEILDAKEHLESGQHFGKIVLKIAE